MKKRSQIKKYKLTCTNISVAADPQFVQRVNAYAKLSGVRTGDLVRSAIEKAYGKDIDSFFAGTGAHEHQMETN